MNIVDFQVTVAGFSGGTIASELTVSSIADDTTVTCRVAPTAGGHSDKSAEALTFGWFPFFFGQFSRILISFVQLANSIIFFNLFFLLDTDT